MKTFELLSIIGSIVTVGIEFGTVIVVGRQQIVTTLRTEIRSEMHSLRRELRADIRALKTALEQRQARTKGLLEGPRDAITTRRPRDPLAQNEAT